jgi:predicted ATPase/DNA-binding SARP family transcriptional activator
LASSEACEFRILGPLEVRLGGDTVAVGGPRPRTLLAALLLAGGAPVSRDRLVEDIWGPEPPASAEHAVQVYVSRLREGLGADAIVTGPGPVYGVACAPEQIDARRFEQLALAGRAMLASDPEQAAASLAEGLALWRGPVLADLAFDGQGRTEVARLDALRFAAAEDRMDAELALGRHRERVAELEALVAEDPLRERARGQLMLALYRSGRQAEALGVYRTGRRLLVDELGLEPGAELRALEQAILKQDPALDAPAPRGRRNLPAPATPLVGREQELEEVARLLRGDARLVTLTGPGGSGKTRLAVAIADSLGERFADGVHFVDLSALRDPRLVAGTIAATLSVADADALAQQLRERTLLLVLDNFEQVDEAAPLVSRLLAAAPGLRALITSRGRLELYGEHEYRVEPLAQPEAVALFGARARARRRDFDVTGANAAAVGEVTRRVEGLPLAIELVAARVGEVDLAEMVDTLPVLDLATAGPRDAPERHRALRATIDWSHDLLEVDQQRLFARLGVFAGGFDDEAAQLVAGAAPEALDALIARSLLRGGEGRRAMLETIRERALERLEDSHEVTRVRHRHADYFMGFAETSEDALKGPDQQAWGQQVEREHDNLRAALEWTLDGNVAARTQGLRMAAALGWFWYTHGHGAEGVRWLERALGAVTEAPALLRGRATHVLGILLSQRADLREADECFRAGLELFREAGDEARQAGSLNSLAANARQRGDTAAARELFEQAVALRRGMNDRKSLADPLSNLGVVAMDTGDFDEARDLLEESLRIDREYANEWGIALNLGNLGALAMERGDLAQARSLLRESLAGLRLLDDRWSLVQALERFAGLAAAESDATHAARLAGAADARRQELGEPLAPTDAAIVDRNLAGARAALSPEEFAEAWAAGAALSLDEALDEAGRA